MLYKCSKCDYRSTIGQLILHRRKHQKENLEEYIQSNSAYVRDEKEKQKTIDKNILFKCFVCNLICTSPGALIFHERTHNKVHKCSECVYSCTTYAQLEIHVKSHKNSYDSSLKEKDYVPEDISNNLVLESTETKIQMTNGYSPLGTSSPKSSPQIVLFESNPLSPIGVKTTKELVEQEDLPTDISRNKSKASNTRYDILAPSNYCETISKSHINSSYESDPGISSKDLVEHSIDYIYEAGEIDIPKHTLTTQPPLLLPDSLHSNRKCIEAKLLPIVTFEKDNTIHQEHHTATSEHLEISASNEQNKYSYEECLLCNPNKLSIREKIEVKTIKGRKALCSASKLRKDDLYDKVTTISPLWVHVDCRWYYINIRKFTRNHNRSKNMNNSNDISEEPFDFHSLCIYCGLSAEIKDLQQSNLSMKGNVAVVDNLEFQEEAKEIYEKYSCIDQFTKKSLQRMNKVCLLNEQARYHIKCYDAFVNHVIETSCFQKAFRKLCKYIDSNEKGLYKLSSLKKFMSKCSPLSAKNMNSLKFNLATYYGKRMVVIWCENEELVTFDNKYNKRSNKHGKNKRVRRDNFGSFIKLDIESVDSVTSLIKPTENKINNSICSSRSLPSLNFIAKSPVLQDASDSFNKSPENADYSKKLNDLKMPNQNTSVDRTLKENENPCELLSLNMNNQEMYEMNSENFISTNLLEKLEKGLCNLNDSASSSSTDGDLSISVYDKRNILKDSTSSSSTDGDLSISVYDTVLDNHDSIDTDINICTSQPQYNDVIETSEISPLRRKPSLKEKFLNKIWKRDQVPCTESSESCNKQKSTHTREVTELKVESQMQQFPERGVVERYKNRVCSISQNISSEAMHSIRPKLSTSPENENLIDDKNATRVTITLAHTNPRGGNMYQCIICHKLLEKGNVKSHLKIHKKELHIECNICSKNIFAQISNFEKHYLWHLEDKTYECELCKKCFPTSKSLKVHMKLHIKQKSYTCKLCSVVFTRESYLIRHQELHTNERFNCNICYKMFNSEFSLDIHMKLHLSKKTLNSKSDNNLIDTVPLCQNDSEKFHPEAKISKDDLNSSPNERSYKSEECDGIFSQPSHLEQHKPMDHADSHVSQSSHLEKHNLKHPKDKLHQCDKCDKRFRSKKERTLHMKLHTVHKVFVCKVCSAEFKRRSNLQSHQLGHLEDNFIDSKKNSAQLNFSD